MRTVLRLIGFVLMISGWAVAALCIHVVRIPDPGDATASKFVVVPKARLNVDQTYVDARGWTAMDVPAHADLFHRVLSANKADQFKYLTNPKSRDDPQTQLQDDLKNEKTDSRGSSTKVSMSDAGRLLGFEISY